MENDNGEVDRDFEVLRKAYTETAESVLGKPRKKKKPWISEESWQLVDEREAINKRILSTRSGRVKQQLRTKYVEKDRQVKRSMKADKRRWLDNIANQAEEAAQSRHMKTLYDLTKTLCNERPKQCAAVMDKDGNILSRKKDIQDRWTEHFKEIVNRETLENSITTADVKGLHVGEVIQEIATNEPTLGEVK